MIERNNPSADATESSATSSQEIPEDDEEFLVVGNSLAESAVEVFPQIGEYWEINNGTHTMLVTVVENDPILVCYFEPCSRTNAYRLNETKFEACLEDFVRKVPEPVIRPVGRNRLFYQFN